MSTPARPPVPVDSGAALAAREGLSGVAVGTWDPYVEPPPVSPAFRAGLAAWARRYLPRSLWAAWVCELADAEERAAEKASAT